MRYLISAAALIAAGLVALPAIAQPPGPQGPGEPGGRMRDPEFRQRMIEEFDKDGDGRLSDEERQAMRETMRERFGRGGPGGPPPAAGEGGPPEGLPPEGAQVERQRRSDVAAWMVLSARHLQMVRRQSAETGTTSRH